MVRTSHRRRRRRAALYTEPGSTLNLLTSRLLPLMVALAMCLVPMLASARDAADTPGTLEVSTTPGAQEWVPCADQGDGTARRLCPSGAPTQARIDHEPSHSPLVEVTVERRSPCPGMAARRAAAAADLHPCPAAQPRQCSRLGRTGKILIGVLLTWYALGMLLGVLLFMRRTLRDDDEGISQRRGQ